MPFTPRGVCTRIYCASVSFSKPQKKICMSMQSTRIYLYINLAHENIHSRDSSLWSPLIFGVANFNFLKSSEGCSALQFSVGTENLRREGICTTPASITLLSRPRLSRSRIAREAAGPQNMYVIHRPRHREDIVVLVEASPRPTRHSSERLQVSHPSPPFPPVVVLNLPHQEPRSNPHATQQWSGLRAPA